METAGGLAGVEIGTLCSCSSPETAASQGTVAVVAVGIVVAVVEAVAVVVVVVVGLVVVVVGGWEGEKGKRCGLKGIVVGRDWRLKVKGLTWKGLNLRLGFGLGLGDFGIGIEGPWRVLVRTLTRLGFQPLIGLV